MEAAILSHAAGGAQSPPLQALPLLGLEADATRAIDYAVSRGVVVIAAAGNEFASICAEPSFNASAMCVVATGPLVQPGRGLRRLRRYVDGEPVRRGRGRLSSRRRDAAPPTSTGS